MLRTGSAVDLEEEPTMYKATVRALVRHGIRKLNDGDPDFLLRLASPAAVIAFPGDNSWSTMHRPARRSRTMHATHRGISEFRTFAERFVDVGLQFVIEDILVNGPPWNTRVAVRCHDFLAGATGDEYNNRAVAFLELRWGRLVSWEDYEDTERVATWDAAQGLPVAN
jgi:ketosteroid isomerase-like protein